MAMGTQVYHWEQQLLELAHQAQESQAVEVAGNQVDQQLMDMAYQYCQEITHAYSRTFHLASGLLPQPKRRAARALYAFCRVSDDLVDRIKGPEARPALLAWQAIFLETGQKPKQATRSAALEGLTSAQMPNLADLSVPGVGQELVALAWNDARRIYQIPQLYVQQLISGVASDLDPSRYRDFHELAHYCYGVACTVGLMSMHIIGYCAASALPYAIRLGVALQLTNILRDIGEDWRNGRLYLPQEELDAFGLGDEDIERGRVTDRWRAFMRFQIERNRLLYQEAVPGIALLDPDGRFAIAAAAGLYQGILDDIQAHDYQVFDRRAGLSFSAKLRRLPGIWVQSRKTGSQRECRHFNDSIDLDGNRFSGEEVR